MSTETIEPIDAKPECKGCGYALAGLGLLIGSVFIYMSLDVLTGGGLTRVLGLGTTRGEE